MARESEDDKAEARLHARIAEAIEAWAAGDGRPGPGGPVMTSFTDDLRGLSWDEQVARVQAVAREHRDRLTEAEAGHALSLYAAFRSGPDLEAG
jgi:hypothetical protein